MDHTIFTCECENCGKEFNLPDGIIAEIKDGKVVTNGNCNPFVQITEMCNRCVKKLGIKLR